MRTPIWGFTIFGLLWISLGIIQKLLFNEDWYQIFFILGGLFLFISFLCGEKQEEKI